MSDKRKPNRLIKEKSPYLLQYAHNPVDWYPWGDEAFQKAKAEGKPIFLSIGYSTCHWCHIQSAESFENEEIAALMNEKFVSIKVDREERPDLDEVYMKAVMALTGQGGWPLSVFLTPDLRPFYGGTYFPPAPRQGMAGFPDVLNFVSDLWKNRREEVVENSEELVKHVQQLYITSVNGTLSRDLLNGAYAELITGQDERYGGFSLEPKFPLPNSLAFLLRYYSRTKKEPALRAVRRTLDSMASGGIHDQLGGGFHRYSTDRYWLVPHFEKMLYDNALLARVYLEAYQVTGEPTFLGTAKDTLDWILSEMTDEEGGFYSAQDADTADGEGYYTWTSAEVEEAIGKEDAAAFDDLFGVTPEGNFEGRRSILHLSGSLQKVSSRFARDPSELQTTIDTAKVKLLDVRRRRARPAVDDKVLTSWNGLTISALAYAYGVVGDQRYLSAGTRSADFLLGSLVVEGKLFRRYRGGDVAIEGTLEDYSFLMAALLDLYEATFDSAWLREAITLSEKMMALFWDENGGGFFMNSSQQIIARIKDSYDGPTPSGNSVAVMSLLRLSELTGRVDFREKAEKTMIAFAGAMESAPSSHTAMLSALDFWFGSREIVLTGPAGDKVFGEMLEVIRKRFLPNKVLALADGKVAELAALTEGKASLGGGPTVYICENFACKSPVTQVADLSRQLDA
jgi:uncharacterized protein YyaL (SSP411 family)